MFYGPALLGGPFWSSLGLGPCVVAAVSVHLWVRIFCAAFVLCQVMLYHQDDDRRNYLMVFGVFWQFIYAATVIGRSRLCFAVPYSGEDALWGDEGSPSSSFHCSHIRNVYFKLVVHVLNLLLHFREWRSDIFPMQEKHVLVCSLRPPWFSDPHL